MKPSSADFAITDGYVHASEAPVDGAIRAFGGEMDLGVPKVDLDAWWEQTTGSFALRMFPGDHFYLNREDIKSALVRTVVAELESGIASIRLN